MASDGKGTRTIFHFAGSDDKATVLGDKFAYEFEENLAKWQVFMDGDRITHIVNMDNVTFIEVVGDA